MPSYEQRFYRESASVLVRLRRNLRLLAYLIGGLWAWLTIGHKTRKAYRRAQERSEALHLEDYISSEEK